MRGHRLVRVPPSGHDELPRQHDHERAALPDLTLQADDALHTLDDALAQCQAQAGALLAAAIALVELLESTEQSAEVLAPNADARVRNTQLDALGVERAGDDLDPATWTGELD